MASSVNFKGVNSWRSTRPECDYSSLVIKDKNGNFCLSSKGEELIEKKMEGEGLKKKVDQILKKTKHALPKKMINPGLRNIMKYNLEKNDPDLINKENEKIRNSLKAGFEKHIIKKAEQQIELDEFDSKVSHVVLAPFRLIANIFNGLGDLLSSIRSRLYLLRISNPPNGRFD
jgi:hypothetical protein